MSHSFPQIITQSHHNLNPKRKKNHFQKLISTTMVCSLTPSLLCYLKHFILEYTIHNWPIPVTNEPYLESIKNSHEVNQLPAYDIRGNPIHPKEYEEKLAGAIARVCFTLLHFIIKQKHVFNALVRDITVLRPPSTITPTSLKHILHPKKNCLSIIFIALLHQTFK